MSLIADVELAARVEAAEAEVLASAGRVLRAMPGRDVPDCFTHEIGGGVASYVEPASPMNKVAGLGFAGAVGVDAWAEIEAAYDAMGSPLQVELASLAEPSVGAMLTGRGYVLRGFEDVLGIDVAAWSAADAARGAGDAAPAGGGARAGVEPLAAVAAEAEAEPRPDAEQRPLAETRPDAELRPRTEPRPPVELRPPADVPSDFVVEHGDEADGPTWVDVMTRGFLSSDADGVPSHESFGDELLRRSLADTLGDPDFVRYLVRRGGEPVGGAAMRTAENGMAVFCGAATLPGHRRRGVQTAVLRRRLRDLAAAGCDLATVVALPGSVSQRNMRRSGFSLLYTRAILVREPGGQPAGEPADPPRG